MTPSRDTNVASTSFLIVHSLQKNLPPWRGPTNSVLGHELHHHGVLESHQVVERGQVERNLAKKMQHPPRRHALAARERHDVFAQIHGSIDGGVKALDQQAGRDDVVADGSKGRAGHAVEGRVLRSKLAQVDASVGDRIVLMKALAEFLCELRFDL